MPICAGDLNLRPPLRHSDNDVLEIDEHYVIMVRHVTATRKA